MFKHITTALTRAAPPPVRAGSHRLGQCERGWWAPVEKRQLRRVVLAARRYDLTRRAAGKRNGPLGHVGLEILDLLASLCDRRTGRLEPSLTYLCAKLRRSRDAVTRALARLKAHGFLDWLRRYAPVHRDGPGPRVKQASNAYRLSLPAVAARLVMAVMPQPVIDGPEKVEAEPSPLDVALAAFARARKARESGLRSGVPASA